MMEAPGGAAVAKGIRMPGSLDVAAQIAYGLGSQEAGSAAELCEWRWRWLLALADDEWADLEAQLQGDLLEHHPCWAALDAERRQLLLGTLHDHFGSPGGRAALRGRALQLGGADERMLAAM